MLPSYAFHSIGELLSRRCGAQMRDVVDQVTERATDEVDVESSVCQVVKSAPVITGTVESSVVQMCDALEVAQDEFEARIRLNRGENRLREVVIVKSKAGNDKAAVRLA